MFVHKILKGIGAEKYLPFALSRLRALEKTYGAKGFFTQKYEVSGYKISVRQQPPFQYLEITGGIFPGFEWFCSNHVDGYFFATPGYRYFELPPEAPVQGFGYVQGHGLRVAFKPGDGKEKKTKVGKPNPLFSHNIPPEGDPEKWAAKSIYDVSVPSNTKSKDYFKAWASWQMQWICEYQWFPNNKPDEMLMTCWGTSTGRLALAGWGDYHWGDVIGGYFPPYDVFIDLPPELYSANSGLKGGLGPYLGDNCWFRRGAMQEVTHETYGKRRYFILGDNKGRLHVYPVKAYWNDPQYYMFLARIGGLLSGASRTIKFKTVTPNYPPWVSLSPVNVRDDLLWWNWVFNKDATKAVTTALHEEKREGYFFYTDESIANNPHDLTLQRAFLDRDYNDDPKYPARFGTGKKGSSPRVLTPGLLEISIKIELTGEEEMDFEVSTTLLRSDYFGDSGRYYVDAAYLYDDERLKKQGLKEDLLVTAEIQIYSADGLWYNRYIATHEGDEQDNPPFHYHFETTLDLYPDSDPPYYYVWRGDPDGFTEGLDRIWADISTVYIIRRGDTGQEIRRHQLSHKTTIADWDYPDRNKLVWDGPNGRPSNRTIEITGIWLHGHYIRTNQQFERYGPGTGPDRGTYGYGGLQQVELRTLSYTIFHVNSTFTGYRLPTPDDAEIKWRATDEVQRYQNDYYMYGEPVGHSLSDRHLVYSGYYMYQNPTVVSWDSTPVSQVHDFTEPPPDQRVIIPTRATMFYGSVNLNFMIVSPYDPIVAHPRGHYSQVFGPMEGIVYRTENEDGTFSDTKTTHLEMFNKAFNQNREISYYNGEGVYGYEAGSYRLAGLWLPYPDTRKKKEEE